MNPVASTIKSELFFKEAFPHCMGFILSRSIYVITKLQVAEALRGSSLTIEQVANKLGITYASQLERVMNYLVSCNIFSKGQDGSYSHTELSQDLTWDRSGKKIITHHDLRWDVLAEASEKSLHALQDEQGAPSQIERLSRLYLQSRAIYVACSLNVFEKIRNGNEVPEVVRSYLEKADLVVNGQLTQTGELFLEKNCKAFVLHDNADRWSALGDLELAITEGTIPFETKIGMPFFNYLEMRPELTQLFSDAMSFVSEHEYGMMLPLFEDIIKPNMTLMDVGGGKGLYLNQILKGYPEVKGILFDLQSNCEEAIIDEQHKSRCQIVGGDFFKEVPQADIYLFKRVLHDWNEEDCIKILKKCAESATKTSKLVMHELLLPQKEALMFDVLFMACLGGTQRTREDFERVLHASGWELESVKQTHCWLSHLVAKKIAI